MTTTWDLVTEDHRTTRSYYGADDRLRGSEGYNCYVEIVKDSPDPSACMAPGVLRDETAGAFEWYRYDALGRRVLVRTRRDHTCTSSECTSSITRVVWDGDQMLFEIRAPGGNVQTWELENDQASGPQHGRVAYTHGPGIDSPLDIIRSGWSGGGGFAVVPIANWRGNYIGGTDATGAALPCQPGCIIAWPGTLYSAFFLKTASSARLNWFGSLIEGKEDANGMFFMRNRYYNPHTGTFTQEDPIGLAGGLNLYGYAGGDPINFSDPFGLCPYQDDANGNRSSDLADCPEDQRREAFTLLQNDRGVEGGETIQAFIDHRLTFELVGAPFLCQHSNPTTACLAREAVRISSVGLDGSARGIGALAADVVHEASHATQGVMLGGAAELRAYDRALNFYGRLPSGLRTDGEYNDILRFRRSNRRQYRTNICNAVQGGC